ncbi:nitric oxide-sensing transcriptional repressor NsrR [Vibrio sp. CK2-1]|uniref:nitric oxide-sensing transcriptional repressor NsrR n=1 Tax=Vibrio sp. CK2-1 TaxID=2912249 RepID=UPI001F17CE0C|nr:nitric oxide-sensing transcriptional repressor NsrR [Vibrio sp. CK2-1]MCF7355681.1 nitric oxide-sensing transcriptional repressor NsrR [Vibrio sp. CK2-1]
MQLTSFTDYGLRSLLYLAALPEGERSNIQAVSERFSIPKNHLIKIINKLAQLGYIQATRGKHGGIVLGKPAEQIVVGQVVRDLEPLQLIDCSESACHITSACRLKSQLAKAKEAFLSQLDQCTLADLLDNNDDLVLLLTPV